MEELSSLLENLNLVKLQGKFITCKKFIQVYICLYEMNKDFIEVWYHQLGDDLLKIEKVSREFVQQRYFNEFDTAAYFDSL
jgi:hypothetical protein